ncbi:MAG: 30S ribosomal protein S8 [Candidatus Omnitrophica bacterium]|nr:30S ribosomal protein S8 [Candidatus Omnitrophota bacterium]
MPVTDSISDMLTVIRNGSRAGKDKVDVKRSRLCEDILKILKKEGYISNFKSIEDKKQGVIRVYLKYNEGKSPVMTDIKRISKPGLRIYVTNDNIPRVLNGFGIAVISTSRGVMTDKDARKEKVGGEVLCYAW